MTHLPAHPTLRDPRTGEPLLAIGLTNSGKPIWPVMGGSQPVGTPPGPVPPVPSAPPVPPVPPVPPTPPVPPVPPVPPTPPVPPVPPTGAPAATAGEHGYPTNTPLSAMTDAQRAAYWEYHSRKHEDRVKAMGDYDALKTKAGQYDALVSASQTEHEKAVADARQQGATEALAGANNKLVDFYMRAAATGAGIGEERLNALLAGLDRSAFITNGEVDTAKVTQFVAVLNPAPTTPATGTATAPTTGLPALTTPPAVPAAPAPTGVPDFGQGSPTTAPLSGLEAGRAEARRRHPRSTT